MSKKGSIRQIPYLGEAVRNAAWRHLAVACPASLSLERLAGELSMPIEAVRSYYADRDELMTDLYIDGFTRFAESTGRAAALFPGPENLMRRLTGVGIAYREWAIANTQRYQLMFGPRLEGYDISIEQLRPAMMRAFAVLADAVQELYVAGKLNVRSIPLLDNTPGGDFFLSLEGAGEEERLVYSVAVILWGRIHGLVSLELSQAVPPFAGNSDVLYLYEFNSMLAQFTNL